MGGQGWPAGQWGSAAALLEHEHVFCMGDLNYRLSLAEDDAREALKKGDMDTLRAADELTKMRATGTMPASTLNPKLDCLSTNCVPPAWTVVVF